MFKKVLGVFNKDTKKELIAEDIKKQKEFDREEKIRVRKSYSEQNSKVTLEDVENLKRVVEEVNKNYINLFKGMEDEERENRLKVLDLVKLYEGNESHGGFDDDIAFWMDTELVEININSSENPELIKFFGKGATLEDIYDKFDTINYVYSVYNDNGKNIYLTQIFSFKVISKGLYKKFKELDVIDENKVLTINNNNTKLIEHKKINLGNEQYERLLELSEDIIVGYNKIKNKDDNIKLLSLNRFKEYLYKNHKCIEKMVNGKKYSIFSESKDENLILIYVCTGNKIDDIEIKFYIKNSKGLLEEYILNLNNVIKNTRDRLPNNSLDYIQQLKNK